MIELTILMPCLNEEMTIGTCIEKAQKYITNNKIKAEILVVDNGSKDNSVKIIKGYKGVKLINCFYKGYGNVLRCGLKEAKGKYIIFADSDLSYDFMGITPLLEELRNGYDYVQGNRFKGGLEKGAMPFSHKLGAPILSFIANIKYKTPIKDYHCGMRGIHRSILEKIELTSEGMEFATELIHKTRNYKQKEVPIILYKDGRNGKSHLRTIRDGFRHLKYIVMN